jgi:hypothetical protein
MIHCLPTKIDQLSLVNFYPNFQHLQSLLGRYAGLLTIWQADGTLLAKQAGEIIVVSDTPLANRERAELAKLMREHRWVAIRGRGPYGIQHLAAECPEAWGVLSKYDVGAQQYAMAHNLLCPRTGDFAIVAADMDVLCKYLHDTLCQVSLIDCGVWTEQTILLLCAIWFGRQGANLHYGNLRPEVKPQLPEFKHYRPEASLAVTTGPRVVGPVLTPAAPEMSEASLARGQSQIRSRSNPGDP